MYRMNGILNYGVRTDFENIYVTESSDWNDWTNSIIKYNMKSSYEIEYYDVYVKYQITMYILESQCTNQIHNTKL